MSSKNFAYSTVLTAPSPATSGTSLVVQSADGTKFSVDSFMATVWPAGAQPTTANAEIVKVSSISTDTFTIVRAQEGTSARTIVVGDQIAMTETAATVNPPGLIQPYAARIAPIGFLNCDGSAVNRTTYAPLFAAIAPSLGTFTVTIATPGVVSLTAHGLSTGDAVYLTTTGALPTGLTANTLYYVVRVDANSFNLATSRANAYAATKINTTGSQSGTHTAWDCPWGLGDGSTTFTLPDFRGRVMAGMDTTGGTAASRLTLANASGVYGNIGSSGGGETATYNLSDSAYAQLYGHDAGGNTFFDGRFITSGVTTFTSTNRVVSTGNTSGVSSTSGVPLRGATDAGNNVMPVQLANFIIKT